MLTTKPQPSFTNILPWLVCFSGALFFFFQFTQMNAFNVVSQQLINTFGLTPAQLGYFSGTYFLGLALFFIPVGLLLDHFSTRHLMLLSISISILATIIFATSKILFIAELARFITGMCHAVAFLGCCRLATRWLAHRLAFIMGLVITIGLSGGIVAQTPLALLVHNYGWRNAFLILASIGMLILILMWLFVYDHEKDKAAAVSKKFIYANFISDIKKVVTNSQNWVCSVYTCLLNLPIMLLGALWGSMYLTHVNHLSTFEATAVTSMIYFGTIIGTPLVGWFSDRINRRKLPMIVGAFLSLVVILCITLIHNLSLNMLLILFFIIGFVTSTQTLSYPVIVERNVKLLTSTALGFASIIIMGGGAIFQSAFGWLIQQNWNRILPFHYLDNYQIGFILLPIAFVSSLVLAFWVRETYCKVMD